MSKNIRCSTPQQNEFCKHFGKLAEQYGKFEAWSSFITLSACSLSLSDKEKKDKEYIRIVEHYQPEDVERFARMFALMVEALEQNPDQDFLGELFMHLGLNNIWKGQFFTPYNLCKMMSMINAGDLKSQLETRPWISVNDPACGAGATLIAFAQECLRQKVNYQTSVLFVAQDVDRVAALMCFVQLSLLGCAGYIVIGNSLTNPVVGHNTLRPVQQEGQEIWYMPMLYSDIWQSRIAAQKAMSLIKYKNNSKEETT